MNRPVSMRGRGDNYPETGGGGVAQHGTGVRAPRIGGRARLGAGGGDGLGNAGAPVVPAQGDGVAASAAGSISAAAVTTASSDSEDAEDAEDSEDSEDAEDSEDSEGSEGSDPTTAVVASVAIEVSDPA